MKFIDRRHHNKEIGESLYYCFCFNVVGVDLGTCGITAFELNMLTVYILCDFLFHKTLRP